MLCVESSHVGNVHPMLVESLLDYGVPPSLIENILDDNVYFILFEL